MQKCEPVFKRDFCWRQSDCSFHFLPAAAGIPAAAAAAYAAYAAGRGFSAAAAGYPGFGLAPAAATGGLAGYHAPAGKDIEQQHNRMIKSQIRPTMPFWTIPCLLYYLQLKQP